MRTALEIMNILVVACKTKVRRKKKEEQKTNNYGEYTGVWVGVQQCWFLFSSFEKVCACVRALPQWMLRDIILF